MKITDLAVLLMKREYAKKGIVLPNQFWNLPKYKKRYSMHMMMAAKFFRTYDSEAIWNVINREAWCFSLNAKCLPDKIEEEQERLKLQKLSSICENKEVTNENLAPTRYTNSNTKNLMDE